MIKTTVKIVVVVAVLASAAGMVWWWLRLEAGRADVHTVDRGDILVGVTVSGAVESRQKSAVAAEIVALVARLGFKEGQHVRRGDVLVELDDRVVAAECAKATASLDRAKQHLAETKAGPRDEQIRKAGQLVKQAEARLQYATKQHKIVATLAQRGAETAAQLDLALNRLQVAQAELSAARAELDLLESGSRPEQIARAEAEVRLAEAELSRCGALRGKYTLSAPHDGTVTARYVHVGEVVSPGQVLLRLDNTEDIEIRAQAQETQLAGIQPGSRARVLADAYPDRPLPAEVVRILPRVEPESGAVSVLLKLTQRPTVTLMDGMAVDIALISEERRQVVRVPASAVERPGEQARVWVRTNTSFQPRAIETGLADGRWVEVVAGLRPGEVIQIR